MEGLKAIPLFFLVLGVAAVIGGATAITLGQFSTTTTDVTALLVINNGSSALATVGNQLGTVGIIGVMVVIIGLLVGVFAYLRYFY